MARADIIRRYREIEDWRREEEKRLLAPVYVDLKIRLEELYTMCDALGGHELEDDVCDWLGPQRCIWCRKAK
jgi:hypothetical protein